MRRLVDGLCSAVAALCALGACGVLLVLLSEIVGRGLPAIRWEFLTAPMRAGGAEGGVFYNLIGTLCLLVTALAFAAPVALALSLTSGVYLRGRDGLRRAITLVLYVLNGVPSILFGILGLIVFVRMLGWGKSWLAGGLLLGLMILPTVTVTLIERIESLPGRYLEAAAGLGLTRAQIVWAVIVPQSAGALVTGSLLGLARAAGETAPIMFTATIFAGATVPSGVKESPVLSLPYHIFVLAQDSLDPLVRTNVWGAAVVLLGLVFSLSLAALPMRLRLHEEAAHV